MGTEERHVEWEALGLAAQRQLGRSIWKRGVDHWDVDPGSGSRERWDVNGNSLTPGQAHGTQPIPFSTQVGADIIIGAAIGYTRFTEGLQNLGDDLRNISPPSFPNSPGPGGVLPLMPMPSPAWFLIP